MATMVPRGVRVLKVNPDLLGSKETPALRVFQDHKVQSDPQERKVPPANQVSPESPEQMDPQVTQARRVLPETKAARVRQGHRVPSDILDLGASRVPMVFVV